MFITKGPPLAIGSPIGFPDINKNFDLIIPLTLSLLLNPIEPGPPAPFSLDLRRDRTQKQFQRVRSPDGFRFVLGESILLFENPGRQYCHDRYNRSKLPLGKGAICWSVQLIRNNTRSAQPMNRNNEFSLFELKKPNRRSTHRRK